MRNDGGQEIHLDKTLYYEEQFQNDLIRMFCQVHNSQSNNYNYGQDFK